MMIPDTTNTFIGRTINPIFPKQEWSSGGSSGGEAALVAARCSPIGIGTDIGGSIWTPANYCGLYALKASSEWSVLLGRNLLEVDNTGKI